MKTIVDTSEGEEIVIHNVYQVGESPEYVTIVSTHEGRTIETMVPHGRIDLVTTYHDEDVVTQVEAAKAEAAKREAIRNSGLSLA